MPLSGLQNPKTARSRSPGKQRATGGKRCDCRRPSSRRRGYKVQKTHASVTPVSNAPPGVNGAIAAGRLPGGGAIKSKKRTLP